MSGLFGILRQGHALCLDDIRNDPECWVNSHIGSKAYYKAWDIYHTAGQDDFYTMVAAMYERSRTTPSKINLYHEWIALYMCSEGLTDEELRYRQSLARRMNDEKERQEVIGGTYPL